MSEPLYIEGGPYKSYPLKLEANRVTFVSIETTTSIEMVNLDRVGHFWVRFDGKPAEIRKPDNFVVFLARRYRVNTKMCTVSMISEHEVWVTVEGGPY
jgi:hypothetical protein